MNLRTEFVLLAIREEESFSDLRREFGISRKTGNKWKQRFLEEGLDGLGDRSTRPQSSPTGLDEETTCMIVKLRLAHPTWGARKLRTLLVRARDRGSWSGEMQSESSFKRVIEKQAL